MPQPNPETGQDVLRIHDLLQGDRCQEIPGLPARFVCRYADAAALLSHPGFSVQGEGDSVQGLDQNAAVRRAIESYLHGMAMPNASRIRALVQRFLRRRALSVLRPKLVAVMDRLLAELSQHPRANVVDRLTSRLPLIAACDLLGVPPDDRQQIAELMEASRNLFSPVVGQEELARAGQAAADMRRYFHDLLARSGDLPDDSALRHIMQQEGSTEPDVKADDLFMACRIIIVSGHENTTNLLGNLIWVLYTHRDRIPNATGSAADVEPLVEETLRLEGPVQMLARVALEDVHFADTEVARGDVLFAVLAAANCDTKVCPAGDRFEPTVERPRHLAFGIGATKCPGAAMARLQASVLAERLLATYPDFTVDTESAQRIPGFGIRGFRSMTVSLRPESAPVST